MNYLTWEDRQIERKKAIEVTSGKVPPIADVILFAKEIKHNPRVITDDAVGAKVEIVIGDKKRAHFIIKQELSAMGWSFIYQPIVYVGDRAVFTIQVSL